jgi:outer membrane protein assembly factor BamE
MISTARSQPPRTAFGLAALTLALVMGGCATRQASTDGFFGLITPFRIDIVQGNVVTKEQVAQVRPGMSREQVRIILGSPMLTDPFHAERWDYLFSMRRPGTDVQRRNVTVWFDGDKLRKIDAPDNLPSENEFVASIAPLWKIPSPRVLELTEDQRKAVPPPKKGSPSTPAIVEATGPIRSYPPLEPK